MKENKKTIVIEDKGLVDELSSKIKEAKEKKAEGCKYVNKDGKHRYLPTGEFHRGTHKEVFRCPCGKEIS